MKIKDILVEATLQPNELFKPKYLDWRPAAFLQKLKDRTPFVDKLTGGNRYIPLKSEYNRLKPIVDAAVKARLKDPFAPVPSIVLNVEGGGRIPLSKLEKADLQTKKGQASTAVNVQPIGIGIAADPINVPGTKPKDRVKLTSAEEIRRALDANKGITTKNLANIILSNKVLDQAGPLGVAIKKAAKEITQQQTPDLSPYDEKTQKVIAIDAGEYLGILEMVYDVANFPKKDQFLKFLKSTDLTNLTVIFPGEQNSQLQDSYGVQNAQTGHTIMISSKGGIGKAASGAAPAISGLEIPKRMLTRVRPNSAVAFIQLLQNAATIEQPFYAWNWLAKNYPGSIPKNYLSILPFTTNDMTAIIGNIRGKGKLPGKYNKIIKTRTFTSRSTLGGQLFYCVVKDLVDNINANQIIPNFRETILEILDENFVQIFTRVVNKKLTATVLWPGKIDGNVSLWTKAQASDPSAAGLSFKVTD